MCLCKSSAVLSIVLSLSHAMMILDNVSTEDFESLGIAAQCKTDLQAFIEAKADLSNAPFWSIKMAESYGGYPREALQEGHDYSLGAYHSCLEVGKQRGVSDDPPFTSQYCHVRSWVLPKNISNVLSVLANLTMEEDSNGLSQMNARGVIKPLLPPFTELLSLSPFQVSAMAGAHYGICVPSSCSIQDIRTILQEASLEYQADFTQVYYFPWNCYSDDSEAASTPDFTGADAAYVSLLGLFALLILLGTIIDLWNQHLRKNHDSKTPNWQTLLVGFSFYSNSKRLLDCNSGKSGQIHCLNGIRFVSMTWVYLAHTYSFVLTTPPVINGNEVDTALADPFLFRVVRNSYFAVDSFFTMGGCLLGYLTFKELEKKKGKLNIPLFYLHRYIRLTVTYGMMIGFFATLFKFFQWGPQNQSVATAEICQDNWWRNILYINNYHLDSGICIGQSWYLSSEFQMFLVSPLILLPMYWIGKKWGEKWSLAYNGLLVTFFTLLIMGLAIVKEWPVTLDFAGVDTQDYVEENYYAPWARCQPYIVGICLGYILHCTKSKKVKINKIVVLSLWLASFAMRIAVVYGIDVQGTLNGTTEELSDFARVSYDMFQHLAWALSLSWLIFACHNGYGGWVNSFLAWEGFIPLGRIAFNIYLIHYDFIHLVWLTISYSLVINHMTVVIILSSVFAMLTVAAFLVSVCFEVPTVTIEKVVFGIIFKSISAISRFVS